MVVVRFSSSMRPDSACRINPTVPNPSKFGHQVLKEKVQHAEEIAEWRMRKLERQVAEQTRCGNFQLVFKTRLTALIFRRRASA